FHPAGVRHSNRWDDGGGRAFHVEFSRSRIAAIGEYATVQSNLVEARCGPAKWLADRLYREDKKSDDLSLLVMEGLALESLAGISRPDTIDVARTPPRWLCKVRDLLHDRFVEPSRSARWQRRSGSNRSTSPGASAATSGAPSVSTCVVSVSNPL